MAADAVIFVPGIKGTKLVNTNRVNFDTIWSGVQSNFETIEDLELTHPLKKLRYDEALDSIIEPGELEELAYAEFLNDLNPGKPIFLFNYDWRYSAVENSELLAEFIEYLVEKSAASRESRTFKTFDFVTHSLGNAIVRAYLNTYEFDRVNKIVFTVPPFKGSLDIVSGAVVGEGWFDNVKAKFRKLIRTMPGALELLPNYDKVSRFTSGSSKHNFFNFDHWQSNITIGDDKPSKDLALKFQQALGEVKKSVANDILDLRELEKREQNRILVITRTGYKTWQSINVHRQADGLDNYFDFKTACKNKHGDGRVPDASSCHYHDVVTTLSIDDALFFRDYNHGFVLKDERVQKLVRRFLSSSVRNFDMNIPGDVIRVVKDLVPDTDDNNMPYWKIVPKQ